MNISISQNFKTVLKNRIKILISPILYNTVDILVDNLFLSNSESTYFSMFSKVSGSIKNFGLVDPVITIASLIEKMIQNEAQEHQYVI